MSFLNLSEKTWMWIFIGIILLVVIIIIIFLVIKKEGFENSQTPQSSPPPTEELPIPPSNTSLKGGSTPTVVSQPNVSTVPPPNTSGGSASSQNTPMYSGGTGSQSDPRIVEHPPIEIDEGYIDNSESMVQDISPSQPKSYRKTVGLPKSLRSQNSNNRSLYS